VQSNSMAPGYKARQLAAEHQLPLVPVHHMEAHALVRPALPPAPARPRKRVGRQPGARLPCWQRRCARARGAAGAAHGLGRRRSPYCACWRATGAPRAQVARMGGARVPFPFLCLLVSGGHNLLAVAEGVGRYELLGATLDDAVGAHAARKGERRTRAVADIADWRSGPTRH